eukprot:10839718-Lingulodinium_polyedra.AAC.1
MPSQRERWPVLSQCWAIPLQTALTSCCARCAGMSWSSWGQGEQCAGAEATPAMPTPIYINRQSA